MSYVKRTFLSCSHVVSKTFLVMYDLCRTYTYVGHTCCVYFLKKFHVLVCRVHGNVVVSVQCNV